MEIKSAKPKANKIVIHEPEQGTTTTTTAATTITAASTRPKAKELVIHEHEQVPTPTVSLQQPSQVKVQEKGKGKMVEPEHVKKFSKKDQLMLDKELAFKLQAEEEEEEEEERLAKEKAQQFKEFNIAWDDIQAKIKRRKFFAAKRAKEKRNKPSTQAQQRKLMCTYLKNIEGWVNTFIDYKTKLVKGSSKKAGTELEQENAKKQKIEDDKESAKLKQCLEIILEDGDDLTIDATPLSSKSPTIVDYKIHKEGNKGEDLKVLWRLLKARFKKIKPVDYMDNLLLHNLKTIFEHHVEDNVWKNQQAQREAVDESVGLQKGLDEVIEQRSDGTLYYLDRIWVPLKGDVRTLIKDESYKLKYSVHP
nr:putative reverse transcriptase domain-containing protein [Tanacetum cinerariifolium]